MKIVKFAAENFKRLQVVQIDPTGAVVTIGGRNGSGKSSVLDAIYVALKGRAANPPRPIREGEEECIIHLDLGDIKITRKFIAKDGGQYTDSLKVENADGLRYGEPQKVLNALLGEVGFDPFEFVMKDPKQQAAMLLQMVPLAVDIDELAEADQKDYQARRDINRDAGGLKAQIDAIPAEEVPADAPDRDALTDALGNAADHNAAINRQRASREERQATIDRRKNQHTANIEQVARLREGADALERSNAELATGTEQRQKELDAEPSLGEFIDTDAIREQLRTADAVLTSIGRQRNRAALVEQYDALVAKSDGLTKAMLDRADERNKALADAPMPVPGLGIDFDDKGVPVLTWEGLPFDKDQISTAVQLRVSTAIGMAANPSLRVLRIKDGSLLDEDSMKLLAEMAAEEDFQLWCEVVGDGGVGIIMEGGVVKTVHDKQGET